MSSRGRTPAAWALVLAVLTVSWAAILVRLCDAPALAIAFYRLFLSSLLILPWAWVRRESSSDRGAHVVAVLAGVMLAVHFASWVTSLTLTSVASSVVLVSTHPVFTALLSPILLRERPGRLSWAAVALSVFGTVVLVGADFHGGGRALLGDALALVGAASYALYLVLGRSIRTRIAFPRYLVVVYGTATAVVLAMAVAGGVRLHGFPSATWLWLVLLAIGPNSIGHSLLNWSVRRLRALTVNLAVLAEPVLATLYAAVLFGELPGGSFYAGAALIVTGGGLVAWEEGRRGG